jgi:DNA-binding MarR family transcriptional regulator
MGEELSSRLAEIGLRRVELSALMLIHENEAITASAIGRMIDIQRANMVPLLKRLEGSGLIQRRPIDGKSHGLSLTAAGKDKVREGRRIVEAFEAYLMGRIPEEHRAHLLPALEALWR